MTLTDVRAGVCTGDGPCVSTPVGEAPNWVTKAGGDSLYVRAIVHALMRSGHDEQDAERLAHGILHRWASGQGNVTAATRARAASALAHWDEIRAKAHASHGARDAFGGSTVTEGSSSGDLLPVGPSPAQARKIVATEAHAFRGSNLNQCTICGLPASATIHQHPRTGGVRHRGPTGHHHVTSGHVAGNPVRARLAAKQAFNVDCDKIEPRLEQTMLGLFDRQHKTVIGNLTGRRGRPVRRQIRAQQQRPPDQPSGAPLAPPTIVPSPDLATLFDIWFWQTETADAVTPILGDAAQVGQDRVAGQLGIPSGDAPPDVSTDASTLAQTVTATTYRQLQQAIADGIAAGDNLDALTKRIESVFTVKGHDRARMIARTGSVAALNKSALDYAQSLPPGTVGRKEWLAHHDTRTRPTHRAADGQTVPLHQPYTVGGTLMMYPGDPAAPPDEVCNCRCAQLFLPPVPITLGGVAA